MQLEYGGQRLTIAAGDFVIGSDPDASLRLAGPSVLPRHAVLRLAPDAHLVILPAAPDAIVEINGTRIGPEPTPLMHGDRIGIGDQEIRVSDPGRGGETRVLSALSAEEGRLELGSSGPATRRSGPAGRLVSLTDGREYSLNTAPFVLGRDAQAQVVIASPDASRRHAEIATVPDGDVLVDLSTNGTYVNTSRISGRHRLKALDVIRIGAEEFRYYPAPVVPPPPPTGPPTGAEYRLGDTLIGMPSAPKMPAVKRPAPSAIKPLAVLLVKKGSAKGERLPVFSPAVNIGRAEYNDVRLTDPSVSASHGKLQLREGVWTLTDLGSTNGTAVDGIPVTDEAPLSPGTVITLGEIDLLFEPHDGRVTRDAPTAMMPKVVAEPAPEPMPASAPIAAAVPPPPSSPIVIPRAEPLPPPVSSSNPPARRSNTVALVIGVIVVLAALAALAFLI